MSVLKVLKGDYPQATLRLPEDGMIIIGRDPHCEIHLQWNAVSRHHARIMKIGECYEISDAGSRSGTFVNGEKIAGRVTLNDGDSIQISDYVFVFSVGVE